MPSNVARYRLWVACGQGGAAARRVHGLRFGAALPLAAKLAGRFAQRFGGQARGRSPVRGGGSPVVSPASPVRAPGQPDPRRPRSAANTRPAHRATAALAGGLPAAWRSPTSSRVPWMQRTRASCAGRGLVSDRDVAPSDVGWIAPAEPVLRRCGPSTRRRVPGSRADQDDRIEVPDGLVRGEPVEAIAVRIGKSYQSVYREIARNRKPAGRYQPWYAHRRAHLRRRRPGRGCPRPMPGWRPSWPQSWNNGGHPDRSAGGCAVATRVSRPGTSAPRRSTMRSTAA
jgi:hypothetical protein